MLRGGDRWIMGEFAPLPAYEPEPPQLSKVEVLSLGSLSRRYDILEIGQD